MKKRILWIEDDYHVVKGLVRPLKKRDYEIVTATSAMEGAKLAMPPATYDLIIVDLILPLTESNEEIPREYQSWKDEKHVGVGLVKWLLLEIQVTCPVLVLSVINDPPASYGLGGLPITKHLTKRGLRPSKVEEVVTSILERPILDEPQAEEKHGD